MLKRVLVLDDNQDILEMVTEVLTYENFDVKALNSSEGIIKITQEFNPDLIILDYVLKGGINGGEICKQIKMNQSLAHIPVLICSAYTNSGNIPLALNCQDMLHKPFDLNQLIEKVNTLISLN